MYYIIHFFNITQIRIRKMGQSMNAIKKRKKGVETEHIGTETKTAFQQTLSMSKN
jgi:hypothetical protein